MKLVEFGSSGLQVSVMGLGLAALGRPGYINLGHGDDLQHNYALGAMQDHTATMLSQAYALGIRYFDAARSYGKAETFLANWLSKQNYHDIICGSKWGYTYTADWSIDAEVHEVKQHSVDVLKRQWDESQDTLGNQLHIYHIHSATLESGVLDNKDVIKRLWELKEAGTIIGLSLSGAGQEHTLEKALSIQSAKTYLFGSVQVTWNILQQSMNDVLLRTFDAGIGVIVKESLANGRLTLRNQETRFNATKILLADMAKAYDVSMDALAIAYVLQQPWSSIVLSGAASLEHLVSNCHAHTIEMDTSDLHRLSTVSEAPEKYWQTRAYLKWN